MNKKDYRKIIKKERHITYQNAWHLGCVTLSFVTIILVTTLLVFINELPIKPFVIIYFLALVFIAIPTIIIDQLNDKQMSEGMSYYEKNHKTNKGIDYVGYLKVLEFISIALLIISLTTIYFRFLRYDYKEILLGDITTIRVNKRRINDSIDIYVPAKFKEVDKDIKYAPEDISYSIVYSDKNDVYLGIYFTDTNMKESEIYNYVGSMEYYYEQTEDDDITQDLNTMSFTHDDTYYYIAFYTYQDKLVQITYSCDKEDVSKWEQGFIAINDNINFA